MHTVFWLGRDEGKRPLGRTGRGWEDNISMDLREIWWKIVEWMHLAKGRTQYGAVVNAVMYLRVP
jgi:hypothetical protein